MQDQIDMFPPVHQPGYVEIVILPGHKVHQSGQTFWARQDPRWGHWYIENSKEILHPAFVRIKEKL